MSALRIRSWADPAPEGGQGGGERDPLSTAGDLVTGVLDTGADTGRAAAGAGRDALTEAGNRFLGAVGAARLGSAGFPFFPALGGTTTIEAIDGGTPRVDVGVDAEADVDVDLDLDVGGRAGVDLSVAPVEVKIGGTKEPLAVAPVRVETDSRIRPDFRIDFALFGLNIWSLRVR